MNVHYTVPKYCQNIKLIFVHNSGELKFSNKKVYENGPRSRCDNQNFTTATLHYAEIKHSVECCKSNDYSIHSQCIITVWQKTLQMTLSPGPILLRYFQRKSTLCTLID